MEAAYSYYDVAKSAERLSEILDSTDASYNDSNEIPSRDSLTFTNGYYVDVSVLFIDMRGSSDLSDKHTRPVLAKIYRAYISEMVAILKSHFKVSEVYIEGDGVWAVYNTPYKPDVDGVFEVAGRALSLTSLLNKKLEKKGYSAIKVGIGMDYGTALYIKAGYKGSGINEVVWIGKVVGNAAHLCKNGNRSWSDQALMVSAVARNNLQEKYQGFLNYNNLRNCYQGEIHDVEMKNWIVENA